MVKPTLIYVYDPLCGWCYGFHPVIEQIAGRFKQQMNFRVIAGGLAVGDNVQSIGEGYSYIPKATGQVEQSTGVVFGRNFKLLAEEGSYRYDSEPACTAQTVVGLIAPDKSLSFAGLMQSAFFRDGKSLNETETFTSLAETADIDPVLFSQTLQDPNTRSLTHQNFEWCREHNASAFPSLLIEIGDEVGLMSRGYRPFDTIESHLHHLIRNIEKMSS